MRALLLRKLIPQFTAGCGGLIRRSPSIDCQQGLDLLGGNFDALLSEVGRSTGMIGNSGVGSGKLQIQLSALTVGSSQSLGVLEDTEQEVVHIGLRHVVDVYKRQYLNY